jgi:GAF domain-containing protein
MKIDRKVTRLTENALRETLSEIGQIFDIFCAAAIENSMIYRQSIQLSQQLRSLFNIAFAMASETTPQRMMAIIMNEARESVRAERASIFLINEGAGVLCTFIADGTDIPPTIPLDIGVATRCVRTKSPFVTNCGSKCEWFNPGISQMKIDRKVTRLTENALRETLSDICQ